MTDSGLVGSVLGLVIKRTAHSGRGTVDLSYLHDLAERPVGVGDPPLVEGEGVRLVGCLGVGDVLAGEVHPRTPMKGDNCSGHWTVTSLTGMVSRSAQSWTWRS
jgi:hypothetical protein